jgi:hypothetical protein
LLQSKTFDVHYCAFKEEEVKGFTQVQRQQQQIIMFRALFFVLAFLVGANGADTASSISQGDLSNPDSQGIKLTESDRIVEYNKRNYTWPVDNYSPHTEGWKAVMEERFAQVGKN